MKKHKHRPTWAALAALHQAQALRDVAAAALWPTLGSSASAQRGVAGGHTTGRNFQRGLDANWALDVFGVQRADVRAAGYQVAGALARVSEVPR